MQQKIKHLFITATATLFIGISTNYASGKEEVVPEKKLEAKRAMFWYQYDNSGPRTDASSYNILSTQPANDSEASDLCPGDEEVCVLRAEEGSNGHPATFSIAFQNEINNAVSLGTETTNVKLSEN